MPLEVFDGCLLSAVSSKGMGTLTIISMAMTCIHADTKSSNLVYINFIGSISVCTIIYNIGDLSNLYLNHL